MRERVLSQQKEVKAVDAALDLLIVIVSRPELYHSTVENRLNNSNVSLWACVVVAFGSKGLNGIIHSVMYLKCIN